MSNTTTSSSKAPAKNQSEKRTSSPNDLQLRQDLIDYAKTYAREKPEVVALWCFGVGFVLGWKLKPW